jgi:dihydroflavonol-4-reductase
MAARDTVLITGASGFVGAAVLRAGMARGYRARVLLRPTSPRGNLEGIDCEIVEGDMRDPESVGRASRGARYVFHVAADYRLWAPRPREIVHNNLEGTRTVMNAALRAGAEKVVYTSSVATLRPMDGEGADETMRLTEPDAIGAYKQSKVVAERLVEHMIAEFALPAVIVNPSTPIGPNDLRPTPTGRVIIEAFVGRIPAFVDTGLNLVHVDDVAEGHFLALEKGRIGQSYILGGQNAMLKDLLAVIATLAKRRPPWLELPRGPLFPLAYLTEFLARFSGKEPLLTVDGLKMSKYRMFFTSAKAMRELGYAPRLYARGVEDAIRWFSEHGYLK